MIVVLAGVVFSVALLLLLVPQVRSSPSPINDRAKASLPAQAGLELPVRLIIPKINVNATVEYVGVTSDGAMGTPKGPDDVAWFNQGPLPGKIGSAVIDGHSGWKNGKVAVFDNLYKLHAGDKIYVEDGTGMTVSFVVRKIRSYDPTAEDTDVFGSHDGMSHLNLITCEGVWDATSKSYSKRLVVFADKEME